MTSVPPELIIVGRVRKAHGIRGDLVVEPITDEPDAVFAPGRRVFAGTVTGDPAKDRRELHVTSASEFKGGLIVHFEEIGDRTVAETWRERYFLVPADELSPLGDDEVYLHEIPGMRVELESGEPVGTVVATYELPQGLTLEVERAGAGEDARTPTVLVPYDRVVTNIDREARLITIDPPAGLLD
jgi:16S rRNA processing protein RimM